MIFFGHDKFSENRNVYDTQKQNIELIIQCGGIILEYETFKDRGIPNLYEHYKNFTPMKI